MPSFKTLSRRVGIIDLHPINKEITSFYLVESIATIGYFMIRIWKHSTAMRREA
ncbi:hypothetical protein [Ferroplasma acidiphilum]|uniref:hypothetical protein n=1 Tax=Ferroplasma acidiphilum TaxID=74969 RepID=UPI0023F54951|nr:hypothetical protein [Ferroplasma acidiphilum]